MKKLWLILISFVAVSALVGGAFSVKKNEPSGKLPITATFYPLAHFAEQVGGDKIQVTTIVPAGTEPHEFEPTAQDIVAIDRSKLFIANGNGLDPWADRLEPDLKKEGGSLLRMSDALAQNNNPDPHFWLSPTMAEQEVKLILDRLSTLDPANAAYYLQRAENYITQLQSLDQDYRTSLANCQSRDIVTSHAAFGYLAADYNLNQLAITGLSPEAEPSSQKLAEIATLAHQKNIKYIFFEELVSPKLSETIAKEVGAQTIAFNPLEGLTAADVSAGNTYITEMEHNLTNLKTALQCQ